jgi:hypothetical protein
MKIQFSTAAILKATAIAAIACGGMVAYRQLNSSTAPAPWNIMWEDSLSTMPLWLPFALLAYAFGRKTFSIKFVVVFAIGEAVAVLIQWAVFRFL